MNNEQLQDLTEKISLDIFKKPFRHKSLFNNRLQTTGGRYLLRSHNIEINPKYYEEHGLEELIGIIKHELCHYHLHLEGRGYQHKDLDFKQLMKQTGSPRHCSSLKTVQKRRSATIHLYVCEGCGQKYERKRRIDLRRYVCGKCSGKLKWIGGNKLEG